MALLILGARHPLIKALAEAEHDDVSLTKAGSTVDQLTRIAGELCRGVAMSNARGVGLNLDATRCHNRCGQLCASSRNWSKKPRPERPTSQPRRDKLARRQNGRKKMIGHPMIRSAVARP